MNKWTPAGRRVSIVTVRVPDGPPVPTDDGGATQGYKDGTPPTWQVAIAPAGALEQTRPGTTLTVGTELVTGPYRADVTTAARLVHGARVLQVLTVLNLERRDRELAVTVQEATA